MFNKLMEEVRFYRGARKNVRHLSETCDRLVASFEKGSRLFKELLAEHRNEQERHQEAKAVIGQLRSDVVEARELALWFEAENRNLCAKLGLDPKHDPA